MKTLFKYPFLIALLVVLTLLTTTVVYCAYQQHTNSIKLQKELPANQHQEACLAFFW